MVQTLHLYTEIELAKAQASLVRLALPNPSWYALYYKGRGQSSGFIGIFGCASKAQCLPLHHEPA